MAKVATINLQPEVQVLIARTHVVDVDASKFNENVTQFIYAYGLKQLLNDAGSAAKTADEKLVMAQKKLEALYEGTVRTARAGTSVDPLTAEMERIAWQVLRAAIMAAGQKLKDVTDEKKAELIGKYLAKYEGETRKKAEANLKAKANVPQVDLTGIL